MSQELLHTLPLALSLEAQCTPPPPQALAPVCNTLKPRLTACLSGPCCP